MAKYGRRRRMRGARRMRKRPVRKMRSKRRYQRSKYRMPKPEKKRVLTANQVGNEVGGQVTNNASGHYVSEITPGIVPGTSSGNRIGDTVSLSGVNLKYQFQQMSSGTTRLKGKVYIVRLEPGYTATAASLPGTFLDRNVFVATLNGFTADIYDYRSERNNAYYAQYKVLAMKRFSIAPDSLTGMINFTDVQINFKKNHTIRYAAGGNSVVSGQLFQFIVFDNGNCGGTTSTLNGVGVVQSNTGAFIRWQHTWYYTDA